MSELFGGGNMPPMPTPPAPVRVPDAEDPKMRAERRRRREEEQVRGGRESTDLSTPYRNPTLGV